jgi:hypothetical protein
MLQKFNHVLFVSNYLASINVGQWIGAVLKYFWYVSLNWILKVNEGSDVVMILRIASTI